MKRFILYIFLSLFILSCDDNSTEPNPWTGIDGVWRITGDEPHLQGFKATDTSFFKYGVWYIGGWHEDEGKFIFWGQSSIQYDDRSLYLTFISSDSAVGSVGGYSNNNFIHFTAKRVSDF